jgi:hypothetical protein
MEHVNDDMDELFRRAAEGYPLNTDSADWNAVVKKLSVEKPVNTDRGSSKNKNYRHLLWLLLLLPAVWVYDNYSFRKSGSNAVNISAKNPANKNLANAEQSKNINPEKSVQPIQPKNLTPVNFSGNGRDIKNPRLNYTTVVANNSSPVQNDLSISVRTPNNKPDKKEMESILPVNNNGEPDDIKNGNKKTTAIEINNDKKEFNRVDTSVNNNQDAAQKQINKKQKQKQKQKQKGLYAGIIISPDISTVKFQSVKNVGVTFGLVIGYQLNKKISVESGVAWDKKFYYSEGKYFSTKRVYTNAQIKNVDGLCEMIEIPFLLKYNFKSLGKTNFSASAGWSSYFMKNEKYDFTIDNNGQQYQNSSTYKNSSTNLLAVANFSVGYNRALRQNITLRIEPYIKIPLKGVGIGSLPIMSTGLNIGITKKLSR